MIIVILVISILLFFLSDIVFDSDNDGEFVLAIISSSFIVVSLISVAILAIQVSNLSVIDQKIAMYEQENAKIEQQIETAITAYQQHEKDVFTEVKPDSYIQLVSIYPELKSDTLVKEQIKTYQSNNKKIKELKVTAINGNVKRWWLYFGHKDVKY